MDEKRDSKYIEDVIDLRVLIQALWTKKWLILSAAFLAGLTAFLVSSFLVQEHFQASAYLTITDPSLRAELETSIQANPVEWETSGLPDLAESAELQQLAFDAVGVTDPEQQRSYELSAAMQGEGQLGLAVIAKDPEMAAKAANAWAAVVSSRINEIYGTNDETLKSLEMAVSHAKTNWSDAQQALEIYLPESRLNSLHLKLSAARASLTQILQEISSNRLLISDTQTLQQQIENLNPAESLTSGTALSLIILQQRAASVIQDSPLQIRIDQNLQVDLTSEEADAILKRFITALNNQNQQLNIAVASIEDDISDLANTLEEEQFQVDQLKQERDLARQAYIALSSQLEESRITLAQEEQPIRIGAEAVEPNQPSSPNSLLNAILAVLIGSILAVGGILIKDWWK